MDYKNPFFLTVLDKGYNSRNARLEAAQRMLKAKLGTAEQIADITGLSVTELQQLQEEMA